jgi:hypothetical protein
MLDFTEVGELFEYRVMQHDGPTLGAALPGRGFGKFLDALAVDGWSPFAVVHGGHMYANLTTFYMRRPKGFVKPQAAAAEKAAA